MACHPFSTRFLLAILLVIAVLSSDRAVAAHIEVASGAVEINPEDDMCSLIEALENANETALHSDCTVGSGHDTIVLAPNSTYTILEVDNTDEYPGHFGGPNGLPLIISKVTLRGQGATIERSPDPGTPEFRLIRVMRHFGDLEIEGLVLRNGDSPGRGGAISSEGKLTLRNTLVADNTASLGGAIAFRGTNETAVSTLIVDHSELSNNTARLGGALASDVHGEYTIVASTIRDNIASEGGGGGIYDTGGRGVLRSSAVTSNSATTDGGGILNRGGILLLSNTTVSGNVAESGGGIWGFGGEIWAIHTTLSGNADVGVLVDEDFGQSVALRLQNTIIANSGATDCVVQAGHVVMTGRNIVEDGSCDCAEPTCTAGDPRLASLSTNGGPTPTHALLPESAAIDQANTSSLQRDQRGVVRAIDDPTVADAPAGEGADLGAYEAGNLTPTSAEVDYESGLGSDGNSVLEPGEQVQMETIWGNAGNLVAELSGGEAAGFTGPGNADYELSGSSATYLSPVGAAETTSCRDAGLCYSLAVVPRGPRPASHWDGIFGETLDDAKATAGEWTVHIGESFADIPRTSTFYRAVETLLHRGVTAGCNETGYCPGKATTRGEMAVFVLRALEGPNYTPPACAEGQEVFDDVLATDGFCSWIEELWTRGVVAGCDSENYCPTHPVTRAQMAVFLLRTLEGPAYTPPSCYFSDSRPFSDVTCPSTFISWIEELYNRGVTNGCSFDPLKYCPGAPTTRSQMAAFLISTFGLTLHGP